MALLVAELADTRAAVNASFGEFAARVQPDAATCTLYDNTESNPRPLTLVLTNARSLTTTRETSKFVIGTAPGGTVLTASDLVRYGAAGTTPPDRWFIVADVLMTPAGAAGLPLPEVQMHALPYLLAGTRYTTVAGTRAQQQAAVNWNNEPYADPVTGLPTAALTPITVRAGLSVDFNPLLELPEGQEPGGITSMYVPLGADVRLDDRFTLPSGHSAIVQQINDMMASGARWAHQLIFNQEG